MNRINRLLYFNGYRDEFGALQQEQVDGLEFLLGALENDNHVIEISWAAYILATVKHETGDTFLPVEEVGKGKGKPYGQPARNGKVFYGRGYVQLTWERNYLIMGPYVGEDLASHPERALDRVVAYCIMSIGMRKGMFTGKKLGDYLKGDSRDYQNARRIINRVDCAEKIAKYAVKFEKILRNAQEMEKV
jgi:hypothetical protein